METEKVWVTHHKISYHTANIQSGLVVFTLRTLQSFKQVGRTEWREQDHELLSFFLLFFWSEVTFPSCKPYLLEVSQFTHKHTPVHRHTHVA